MRIFEKLSHMILAVIVLLVDLGIMILTFIVDKLLDITNKGK